MTKSSAPSTELEELKKRVQAMKENGKLGWSFKERGETVYYYRVDERDIDRVLAQIDEVTKRE